MVGRIVCRRKQLDVIDLCAVRAGNAGGSESLAHLPRECRELLNMIDEKLERMLFNQKEPVASPRHISVKGTVPWHVNRNPRAMTIRINIPDGDFAVFCQRNSHVSDGSFKEMLPQTDSAEIGERGCHPDHAMTAHTQIPSVVEENHACCRRGVNRFNHQCADQYIGPTRFAENCAAVNIMFVAQLFQAL